MQLLMDALKFDRLLTPTYIKYLYWLLGALSIVGGVFGLVISIISFSISGMISCVISTIVGLVFLRVFCEAMLVMFLIEARLRELNQRIGGGR